MANARVLSIFFLLHILTAALLPMPANAQIRPAKFDEIKVQPPDAPKDSEFILSSAAATSESPVVISVSGRKLRKPDRAFRTWLQRYWMSMNVPESMKLVARSLVQCEYERPGEDPLCDEYEFENPTTGQRELFLIYVGNWP